MNKKDTGYLVFYYMLSLLLFLFSCSPEKQAGTERPVGGDKRPSAQTSPVTESEKTVQLRLPSTKKESMKKEEPEAPSTNNPPVVEKAKLHLETLNNTDLLRVVAEGSDKDGDEVTFKYAWTKNGEPAGEGNTIKGLKRGDKVSVKITPFDGTDYGLSETLSIEIENTPPGIMEHKDMTFDGKTYTYQVKATDPDGDPLTFKLTKAPEGMKIDEKSGLITWAVGPDITGTFPVQVSVTDGHGGKSTYDFKVTIKVEAAK